MSVRDKKENSGRERGCGAGVSERLNVQYVHMPMMMMMVSSGFEIKLDPVCLLRCFSLG